MNKIYLLMWALLAGYGLAAQKLSIKGIVADAETNVVLPNAIVHLSGMGETVTDAQGFFSLGCAGDSTDITVSFIGYETYQQSVACGAELRILLKVRAKDLNLIEVAATSGGDGNMLYQPASISRIGETEIKRGVGLLMDDAINTNMPGVYMQRRTFSAGQQFSIRGYGNGARGTNGINSNFDGQGYKVYLNGIPITDAEGITLMDDIDFGSIGNVEVIKGPSGTLYGQAIAGVVNLKTIKPQPGTSSVGQEVIVGSYGLQRYTTSLQASKERSSVMVNYGDQKYDGFMPHTRSDKKFVNFFGEFAPNRKQSVTSYFGFSKSYDERNGEITPLQWDTLDYSGNPAYIKNNAHSNVMTFRTGIGHTYWFGDKVSNTTSIFGTGLISNVSSAGGWTDRSSVNYGMRSTFDLRLTLGRGYSLNGITGTELQMQNAQTLGYPMLADSSDLSGYNLIGTLRSNQYTISRTASVFTEWTLSLPYEVSVTAGVGWSGLGIELNDRFYVATNNNPSNPNATDKPSKYRNSFNDMFSPHVSVNKVFSRKASVYASFSQGYKAPVSSYFFVPLTGEVLTGLKPEKGTQFEVGSKGSWMNDRLNYQFAVFRTNYEGKMTTIAVPNALNTATSYVYVANGGEQINQGLEVAVRYVAWKSDKFWKTVTPFVNFTYSDFHYGAFRFQQLSSDKKSVVEKDFSRNVVAGVPPVVFNAGFDLTTRPGFYANMTYSFRDHMYYTSDNKNQTTVYRLLNAKVGYSHVLVKHIGLDVYAGCNNITNNQNYAMVFLNQLPDAYLPAPNEINYFGGVNVKYIF